LLLERAATVVIGAAAAVATSEATIPWRYAMEANVGGGILLWLLGVPIPIIILLLLLLH
jgi:hypothetical protein